MPHSFRPIALAAALASAGLFAAPAANGATLNIAADGTLMGASGVNVLGTLYDVTFSDGLLKDGVTVFTDEYPVLAASNALLDQVFLGDYDTLAKDTNGCSQKTSRSQPIASGYCEVFTPYVANANNVFSGAAFNWTGQTYAGFLPGTITVDNARLTTTLTGGTFNGPDSTVLQNPYATTVDIAYQTIARWSPHVSVEVAAVPEPQSWALMLAGFAAVGATARRRLAARAAPGFGLR